jgi:Transglutaminase-like superfamily
LLPAADRSHLRRPSTWLLLGEATFCTSAAYVQVRMLPFHRVAALRRLQTGAAPLPGPVAGPDTERVGWAVRVTAARTPWTTTCLMQALAAAAMLHRRGVASCIHLGVAADNGSYTAHAWLSAGPHILTGNGERERYTEVGRYWRAVA